MAAKLNLTIFQGSDFKRAMTLKDELGDLINLSTYSFKGQARESYESELPSFEFEFIIRDQETDEGVVEMFLSSDSTSAMDIKKETKFIYDIEMTIPGTGVRRLLEGSVRILPEVTR